MRKATWADLGTVDRGLGPPEHHGHPYYIRTERERAYLLRRAEGLGPIRVAADICGTLLQEGMPLCNPKVTCDPTLPRGSVVPE
jgi:hypothetical protein